MNIEEIKNKLIKELNDLKILLEHQKKETKEILTEPESASDIIADIYEFKQESNLTIESLEARIKEIEKALEKIEKGTYGICEKCHQPIEEERLKIDLAAYLCRKCYNKKNP